MSWLKRFLGLEEKKKELTGLDKILAAFQVKDISELKSQTVDKNYSLEELSSTIEKSIIGYNENIADPITLGQTPLTYEPDKLRKNLAIYLNLLTPSINKGVFMDETLYTGYYQKHVATKLSYLESYFIGCKDADTLQFLSAVCTWEMNKIETWDTLLTPEEKMKKISTTELGKDFLNSKARQRAINADNAYKHIFTFQNQLKQAIQELKKPNYISAPIVYTSSKKH